MSSNNPYQLSRLYPGLPVFNDQELTESIKGNFIKTTIDDEFMRSTVEANSSSPNTMVGLCFINDFLDLSEDIERIKISACITSIKIFSRDNMISPWDNVVEAVTKELEGTGHDRQH